jgi:hypothetical protein
MFRVSGKPESTRSRREKTEHNWLKRRSWLFKMTGRLRAGWESKMTDNSHASQLSPGDLIEQAIDIIMNRFDIDAAQALKVLRAMSRATRTQMCVIAERLINDNDPAEASRREQDAPLRLVPETKQ